MKKEDWKRYLSFGITIFILLIMIFLINNAVKKKGLPFFPSYIEGYECYESDHYDCYGLIDKTCFHKTHSCGWYEKCDCKDENCIITANMTRIIGIARPECFERIKGWQK